MKFVTTSTISAKLKTSKQFLVRPVPLLLLTACAPHDLSGIWWGEQTCTGQNEALYTTVELTLEADHRVGDYELLALLSANGDLRNGTQFSQSMDWDGRLSANALGQIDQAPETITIHQEDYLQAYFSQGQFLGEGMFFALTLEANDAEMDCIFQLNPD